MPTWDQFFGGVCVVGGIYGFLIANGTLPRNPRDPEAMALWRRKFGRMARILSPIVMVYGALRLVGFL